MTAQDSTLSDLSGDAAAVHAVAEALRRAVNDSDVNSIVACWAPDGIMLPPHHPAVHGRDAIGEYFSRVFAARRLTFTFTKTSIDVVGDIAIELLYYTAVATAPGGETTDDVGKGIHIYRRRAGGTWQLTKDIWNSDRRPN
jgi:uncharacterized protein (TIGR02246 family)